MSKVRLLLTIMFLAMSLGNNLSTIAESCINVEVCGQGKQVVSIPALMSDGRVWQKIEPYLLLNDLRASLKKVKIPLLLIGSQGGLQDEQSSQFATSLYQQAIESVTNAHFIANTNVRNFIMWDDEEWLMAETDLLLKRVLLLC
jgi:hypothetical protein